MIIETHPQFIKAYNRRITPNHNLAKRFSVQSAIFEVNQKDKRIKDHKLLGRNKDKRSFWVTGDIRVIYRQISPNHVQFLDIGTHNQVY